MRSTWKICNTSDLPPREGQAGCTPAAPRLARSGHQVQAEKRLAWGAFADHQHGIASSSLSKVYDTHMILGVTWSLQVPCLQCDLLHSCGRWYAKHLESRTGPARHQTLCPQMFPFGLFSSIFLSFFGIFSLRIELCRSKSRPGVCGRGGHGCRKPWSCSLTLAESVSCIVCALRHRCGWNFEIGFRAGNRARTAT